MTKFLLFQFEISRNMFLKYPVLCLDCYLFLVLLGIEGVEKSTRTLISPASFGGSPHIKPSLFATLQYFDHFKLVPITRGTYLIVHYLKSQGLVVSPREIRESWWD
jgi:hypothetical protein